MPVALLLRGDGTWSEIATPPDEALGGLFPISGLESAQFVTSTGILLGYDEASDEWTTNDSGVAQVEGACGFGTSWAVVGRLEVTAGMDHSLDGWPDLSVVTGEGRETELPRTGSASGEVVCGQADQTVAWVSWLSPSYVVDLLSGVTHELPPLTQGTSIGKGAANSDAHLAVPIYSHDGTKAGATSRLASIVPGDDADWKFTSWAFDSLPDVKAAVATDTAIVAVVARTDGVTPQDPVVRYELVTWNP